jgi:hypothetical protein
MLHIVPFEPKAHRSAESQLLESIAGPGQPYYSSTSLHYYAPAQAWQYLCAGSHAAAMVRQQL